MQEIHDCYIEQFVGETLNSAVLDSDCITTVCGENWLICYMDTLPDKDMVSRVSSNSKFKFGDGNIVNSNGKVNLPVKIGDLDVNIETDIVSCELPLLLSQSSMKAADAELDFRNDKIKMFGQNIPLNYTASGHYCIPLTKNQQRDQRINVFLTIKDLPTQSAKEKDAVALKLHKKFGHPVNSKKLKVLVKETGIQDVELEKSIDKVTKECDLCNRYRKPKL